MRNERIVGEASRTAECAEQSVMGTTGNNDGFELTALGAHTFPKCHQPNLHPFCNPAFPITSRSLPLHHLVNETSPLNAIDTGRMCFVDYDADTSWIDQGGMTSV